MWIRAMHNALGGIEDKKEKKINKNYTEWRV